MFMQHTDNDNILIVNGIINHMTFTGKAKNVIAQFRAIPPERRVICQQN